MIAYLLQKKGFEVIILEALLHLGGCVVHFGTEPQWN
jgi:phytoene dehydrogenase-like protein